MPLRDFEAYFAAGATWNAGGDPYAATIWTIERRLPGVVTSRTEMLPFVGPPWVLPIVGPLARLPFPIARAIWWTVVWTAAVTIVLGSLWLAPGARRPIDVLAVAAVAIAFGPIQSGLALGQLTLVACAAFVATLLSLRLRSAAPAIGAFVTLFQPNVALPLVALVRERQARVSIAVTLLIATALSLFAGGIALLARYPAVLRAHNEAERCSSMQMTVHAVACGFGAPDWLAEALAVVALVTAGAVVIWAILSPRYDWLSRVAIACAATPIVLPFAHEHTLAITFLPAILCVRQATGGLWLAAAFAGGLLAVNWLGMAEQTGSVAQSAWFGLAAVLALMALPQRPPRSFNTSLLILPLAVLAAAVFGSSHHVGRWPESLPASFAARGMNGAATIWHAELLAAGLAATNPSTAALRSFSLLGSSLLLLTSVFAMRHDDASVNARALRPG